MNDCDSKSENKRNTHRIKIASKAPVATADWYGLKRRNSTFRRFITHLCPQGVRSTVVDSLPFGFSACEIKDFFASFRFRFSRNGGLERFRAVRQSSSLCRHALTLFMPSLCSASASHYASLCSGLLLRDFVPRRHSPISNWVRIQHSDPVFHILLPSPAFAKRSRAKLIWFRLKKGGASPTKT